MPTRLFVASTLRTLVSTARSRAMDTVPLPNDPPMLTFVVEVAAPLVPMLIVLVEPATVAPVPMSIV